MNSVEMYPLRFEPIYQYRLWGGRRLANLLAAPLPGDGPIGEAWLLSDRDDHPSQVADGPLKGSTLQQLREKFPEQILGKLAGRFHRFPVLLKFLDVHQALSVQVHPKNSQTDLIPAGESGKTESWVVLEAGPEGRIFAGLKPGTTREDLERTIDHGQVADRLASFTPEVGDAVFIPAGTVHSLKDVVVFETQQNSDVTYRLYDWNHTDPKTGKPRPLQVKEAMACIDFNQVAIGPITPVVEEKTPENRECLFDCEHFSVWRYTSQEAFHVGANELPRILVCTAGEGKLHHHGARDPIRQGDVVLLPAALGRCLFEASGIVNLLEVALPE